MQFIRFGASSKVLGAAFGAALALFGSFDAEAASRFRSGGSAMRAQAYDAGSRATARAVRGGMGRYAAYRTGGGYGRLQCVPFARENTGIELAGNASHWWGAADGVYARGARPEVGSILNFRANGRMRMGHVAVVSNVVNTRTIEIDHANWPGAGRGGVSRNMSVVDVSEGNDWTAVRVELGRGGDYGSIYPTYGFIYDRADTGAMMANNGVVPSARAAAAPRFQVAAATEVEEVAEADDEVVRPRSAGRRHVVAGRRAAPAGRIFAARVPSSRAAVQHVAARTAPSSVKPAHAGHRHRL